MSKVAIVTGGSSGIGLAFARAWVERGGRAALVARTERTLADAVRELGGESKARAYPLDVRDVAAVDALPARVKADMGRVDVVVNNAGLNHRGSVRKYEAEELANVIGTNLVAPIVLTRASLAVVEQGGAVVQVASIAGMVPVPGEATYCASKAGLRAFARAVADDEAARGIHIGCVSPGPVDTGFLGDLSEVPDIVLSQPMVTPEDVAVGILRCIDERIDEVVVPAISGKLATMGYLLPGFAQRIRPVLEKRGAKNRQAIVAKRRSMS
jgi:short-subunit dehydrogenase